MASYRYWRLYAAAVGPHTSSNSYYLSFGEVELRGTVGGANLATTTGNMTASSTFPDTTPGALIDGSVTVPAGRWVTNSESMPHWWRYDFGSATEIREVMLRVANEADGASRSPTEWVIQGSTDDSTWVTVQRYTQTSWTQNAQYTFTVPTGLPSARASYRYYRLTASTVGNGGGFLSFAEIEIRGVVGGANLATTGANISADSSFSGSFLPANMLDSNTGTRWASTGTAPPHWWQYDFGSATTVDEYKLVPNNPGIDPTDIPTAWVFAGSDDGSTWTTLDTRTQSTWKVSRPYLYILPSAANVSAHRRRFAGIIG